MKFNTYIKVLQAIEFVIYFAVASLLLFVVFPPLDLSVILSIVFSMLGVIVTFGIVMTLRRNLIARKAIALTMQFNDTLDTSLLVGIKEYFLNRAQNSPNQEVMENNLYIAYGVHNSSSDEPFEYNDNIVEMIEKHSDTFSIRAVYLRDAMIYNLIERSNLKETLKLLRFQLDYIERMVDEKKVPEELIDETLNLSSVYRHIIRFIQSPNPRTAYAIYPKEKGNNLSKVNKHHLIVKIFLENGMKKEAKETINKVKDISGDYRLLKGLKEYRIR